MERKPVAVLRMAALAVFLAVLTVGVVRLIVFDRSAVLEGDRILWKGRVYVPASGEYSEGRPIAKTSDGSWKLDEVKEDPSHTFIVLRSFLDQYLYVDEAYEIPRSGRITAVCVGYGMNRTADAAFCAALERVLNGGSRAEPFELSVQGSYHSLTETRRLRDLHIAYENCPVCTEWKGALGTADGKTVFAEAVHSDSGWLLTCFELTSPDREIIAPFLPQ